MRNRVAGQMQRDKNGRNRVGQNQHAILGDLGVGDALHAAKNRVHEHDTHTDIDTGGTRNTEEAREGHPDAGHLTDNVGHRRHQQAENRHRTGTFGIVAGAEELGNGKFAEFAQVGGQQHGKQNVATGPAHQEQTAAITHVGDKAGHGDKRSGRHPVSAGCHTVHNRVN